MGQKGQNYKEEEEESGGKDIRTRGETGRPTERYIGIQAYSHIHTYVKTHAKSWDIMECSSVSTSQPYEIVFETTLTRKGIGFKLYFDNRVSSQSDVQKELEKKALHNPTCELQLFCNLKLRPSK